MSPAALPGIEAGTAGVGAKENEVCMTGTAAGLPGMTTEPRLPPGVEGSGSCYDDRQATTGAGGAERREVAPASDRSSDGGGRIVAQAEE